MKNKQQNTPDKKCPARSGTEGGASVTPIRIQRKRAAGWRKPAGTVYVGRGSRWGNPYRVGQMGRIWAVVQFERHLESNPQLVDAARRELRGKNLMCWCALDQMCHADVLLRVANEVTT